MKQNGLKQRDLMWHLENPVRIDERGGNYYPLNEEKLLNEATWRAPSWNPAGPAELILEYAARLPYPLSFTETNIQGTVRDRISWLKYVLEQDAQGIISCGAKWERVATELTDLYAKVAGGANSAALPAYEFSSMHDRTLGALKRQLKWNWREQ